MTTDELLLQLLTGGLLGMLGQILRIAVGYKKMYDEASQTGKTVKDILVPSAIIISLLIGFAAGALALISMSDFKTSAFVPNPRQTILTLIAGGYAGTDLIEGFIKKYLPNGADSNAGDGKNNGQ